MDMQNRTLITLCWELYEQGIPKVHIAKRLDKNRETIHIWIQNIKEHGLLSFLDNYEQSKKGERKRRQVDPLVKRLVWEIREREYYCCGQKIQYYLELERGIHLSVPKIYEILAEKYLIRSKWKKNLIQTDGGPEFKADFLIHVHSFCDRHRVARPYRKNEQSYIESFNRTVRKECLGWSKYRAKQLPECIEMVESFLKRYHYHRPHMSLGMKPPLQRLKKEVDCRIFTEN
jgi:transposase